MKSKENPAQPAILFFALVAAGLSVFGVPASSRSVTPRQPPIQARSADASIELWQKQLVLTPEISARLAWAHKALAPAGIRKLEALAVASASEIASGTDFATLQKRTDERTARAFPGLSASDVSATALIVLGMAAKDMNDDLRTVMAEMNSTNQAKQKLRDQIRQLNDWISQEMSKAGRKSSDLENSRAAGAQPPASRAAQPAKSVPARSAALDKRISPVLHLEYAKTPDVSPLPPRGSGTTVQILKSLQDDLKGKLDGMNEMSEMTSLRLQMTMDRRAKFIATLSNIMKKIGTTQETVTQNIK
jgi:hypothetical protein